MAGDTSLTVVGNLVADPELRFTQSGTPVCNFRVASTPSAFDKTAQEWRDGETLFVDCTIWRAAAEHVAASLAKGHRVVVSGRMLARTYTTREGEQRTTWGLEVDEVGPSLRYTTARVEPRQPVAAVPEHRATAS